MGKSCGMVGQSCGLNGSILWPEWVSSVAPIGQSCGLSRSVGQSCGPCLLQRSDSFLKGLLIVQSLGTGVGVERGLRCFHHGLVDGLIR